MTIDELIVKLVLDASGFAKGQAEAVDSASKMAEEVTKSAEKAEKAQVDAAEKAAAAQAAAAEKAEKAVTTAAEKAAKEQAAAAEKARKAAEAEAKKAEKAAADAAKKAERDAEKARKASEGEGKKVQEANAKTVQSFEGLVRSALTFFAVLAGTRSIGSFVSSIIGLDAAAGRLAHNVGSTPEVISSIGQAVERMGGTFEGAASGIQGFSDAFQELRTTGQSGMLEPLAKLQSLGGVPIKLSEGWHKAIYAIGDDIKALEEKGQPALADYLGRQVLHDPNLVNWAKRGSAAMKADEAASKPTTKEAAENAIKYQAAWAALSQSVRDVGQALVLDFGPAIMEAMRYLQGLMPEIKKVVDSHLKDWIAEVTKWFREHQQDIKDFGSAILSVVSAAGQIAVAFATQSPMMVAFEAFATLLGVRVLGAITGVTGALKMLGITPMPPWLLKMLGIGGVVALGASAESTPNAPVTTDPVERARKKANNTLPMSEWTKEERDEWNSRSSGDTRTLYQKLAPKWAGGKDAPGPSGVFDGPKGREMMAPDPAVAPIAQGSFAQKSPSIATRLKQDFPGLTNDDAAAVLGNLGHESAGFKAFEEGGNGPGRGWAQWTDPGRKARFFQYAKDNNLDPKSDDANYGFLKWELQNTHKGAIDALKGADGVRDKTRAFERVFEGAGVKNYPSRDRYADTALKAIQDQEVADASQPTPSAPATPVASATLPSIISPAEAKETPKPSGAPVLSNYMGKDGVLSDDGMARYNKDRAAYAIRQEVPAIVAPSASGRDASPASTPPRHPASPTPAPPPSLPLAPFHAPEIGGSRDTNDRALLDRYKTEHAAPKAVASTSLAPFQPPEVGGASMDYRALRSHHHGRHIEPVTWDDAAKHVMRGLKSANDNRPVKVEMTDASAARFGEKAFGSKAWNGLGPSHAHLASMPAQAMAARHAAPMQVSQTVSNTSDTKIGAINVHTAATDAKGIAADIEPYLRRGQAAGRANYGLA